MDNDKERRNKPTLHSMYGTNIALLIAFELIIIGLSLFYKISEKVKNKEMYFKIVKKCLMDLVIGQTDDIRLRKMNSDELVNLFKHKTSSLFKLSFVLPYLINNDSIDKINDLLLIGEHFGILFQIHDDYLDYYSDKNKVINIVLNTGNNFAFNIANKHYSEITNVINKFDLKNIKHTIDNMFKNIQMCHEYLSKN